MASRPAPGIMARPTRAAHIPRVLSVLQSVGNTAFRGDDIACHYLEVLLMTLRWFACVMKRYPFHDFSPI